MKPLTNLRNLAAFVASATMLVGAVSAKDLAVAQVNQRFTDSNGNQLGDNWCWAACSKMILDFYGHPQTLPGIVTFGIGNETFDTWNYVWGSGTELRTGVLVWQEIRRFGVPSGTFIRKSRTIPALQWNGIDAIIKNFSANEVQTQRHASSLTAAQITQEIDENDAPFVVRIGWSTGGGHFIVCYGTDVGIHSIRDPWFGSYLKADAALRTGTSIDGTATHTWTHTLTTSKILDVVFLFDTTGSMGSSIASAKASANGLIDKIAEKFKSYRIAVANYKDFPQDPFGDEGDYVYQANLPFTKDKESAQAAINSLSAGGGNDIPESVYSALSNALAGNGLGPWRDNPARRIIILVGDAAGHDPEPWPGGTSFNAVTAIATADAKPIAVHCLLVGIDIDATNQFSLIAGASGGSVTNAIDGEDVGPGLQAIVDSVAENPRFPKGEIGAIFPTFSFDPLGEAGMTQNANKLFIEVQKSNAKRKKWTRLRLFSLQDTEATVFTSSKPLAIGKYRWRLGFNREGGELYLPALGRTVNTNGSTSFEPEFVEFDRVKNVPGEVTLLTPAPSFTATETTVEFTFGTVSGATSYVIQVLKNGKVIRNATVKPPKDSPDAEVLVKSFSGLKVNENYTWRVQALNFDRPKIAPSAWLRNPEAPLAP